MLIKEGKTTKTKRLGQVMSFLFFNSELAFSPNFGECLRDPYIGIRHRVKKCTNTEFFLVDIFSYLD